MLKGGLMKMKKEASVEAVRESAGAISSHFPVHYPLSETITLRLCWSWDWVEPRWDNYQGTECDDDYLQIYSKYSKLFWKR